MTVKFFFTIFIALLMPLPAIAAGLGTLYKNPDCTCCEGHAEYLEKNGFKIKIITTDDLESVRKNAGVPGALEGCHTLIIDGYVIEGHVPVDLINRLLTERSKIVGISLPGMPANVPGMGGSRTEPLEVYEIATIETATPKVFATIQ